jgi:hypothetical protein
VNDLDGTVVDEKIGHDAVPKAQGHVYGRADPLIEKATKSRLSVTPFIAP